MTSYATILSSVSVSSPIVSLLLEAHALQERHPPEREIAPSRPMEVWPSWEEVEAAREKKRKVSLEGVGERGGEAPEALSSPPSLKVRTRCVREPKLQHFFVGEREAEDEEPVSPRAELSTFFGDTQMSFIGASKGGTHPFSQLASRSAIHHVRRHG